MTVSWTGANCTTTVDTTAGHFVVGSAGINASWTGAVTATMTKTITTADLHLETGQNSGTPSQGTAGLWVWATDYTKITSISLKLGSSASNYATYLGETFAHRNSVTTATTLQNGLNYLLFDLNSPTSVTGTPNWTATAYAQIIIVTSATSNATFDYLTASKSNNLGLNGLGNRSATWTSTTFTW
jgi:hypothetical protein